MGNSPQCFAANLNCHVDIQLTVSKGRGGLEGAERERLGFENLFFFPPPDRISHTESHCEVQPRNQC